MEKTDNDAPKRWFSIKEAAEYLDVGEPTLYRWMRENKITYGKVRTTGLNYFTPRKTKFWTLKDSFVQTSAKMCARCGAIIWFGDLEKLTSLQKKAAAAEPTHQQEERET